MYGETVWHRIPKYKLSHLRFVVLQTLDIILNFRQRSKAQKLIVNQILIMPPATVYLHQLLLEAQTQK